MAGVGSAFSSAHGKWPEPLPLPQTDAPNSQAAPKSLALDQGTLRAPERRLPKPEASGQVWEVSGDSRSGADAGSLHPDLRGSLSPGIALGAPGRRW